MSALLESASSLPRNTILQGDCLRHLPQLPAASVDFILTDPPYLVNYRSRDGQSRCRCVSTAWLRRLRMFLPPPPKRTSNLLRCRSSW